MSTQTTPSAATPPAPSTLSRNSAPEDRHNSVAAVCRLTEAAQATKPLDNQMCAAGHAGQAAKRKNAEYNLSSVMDPSALASGAGGATKKQKAADTDESDPTGVAVLVCCVKGGVLHVLGFEEDRHQWPAGARESWDAQFLRYKLNNKPFKSSPFQLYTDVPNEGLHVPGCVFEDGKSQHWTRKECLRTMLMHMLSKEWCPTLVAQQFCKGNTNFQDFVQPFKEREKLGIFSSWKSHLCDQLSDETWDAFRDLVKANQPDEQWHNVTVPAENCRGKDMTTTDSRRAEAARALQEEAGLLLDASSLNGPTGVTKGKYKTSVHAIVVTSGDKTLEDSQQTLDFRQQAFPWWCPHNWPGARGTSIKKAFGEHVKAYRETRNPRWVSERDLSSFDAKSQAAIHVVLEDVKESAFIV
jgi:hypothetical protein